LAGGIPGSIGTGAGGTGASGGGVLGSFASALSGSSLAADFVAPGVHGPQAGAGQVLADAALGGVAGLAAKGIVRTLDHVIHDPDGLLGRATGLGDVLQRFGLAPESKEEKRTDG
jgi:hypothetical protein